MVLHINYKIYNADGMVIASGSGLLARKQYVLKTFKDMQPDGILLEIDKYIKVFHRSKYVKYLYNITADGIVYLTNKSIVKGY